MKGKQICSEFLGMSIAGTELILGIPGNSNVSPTYTLKMNDILTLPFPKGHLGLVE